MTTDKKIQAFLEELTELKEKHGISAVAGVIFQDAQFAPFKIMKSGKLILQADHDYCTSFYNTFVDICKQVSGNQSNLIYTGTEQPGNG